MQYILDSNMVDDSLIRGEMICTGVLTFQFDGKIAWFPFLRPSSLAALPGLSGLPGLAAP